MGRFFRDNAGKIFLVIFAVLVCYAVGKMIYETFWGTNGFIPIENETNIVNDVQE